MCPSPIILQLALLLLSLSFMVVRHFRFSKGPKMARFYLIGWTVLLGSIIVQALAFLSVIPFHPRIFEEVPAIGAIFESIFYL